MGEIGLLTRAATRRTITIVGGGQSGLMLAIGLRRNGYAVHLVQDRSGATIMAGRVTSSQCMFGRARDEERKLGLDLWSSQVPKIEGIRIEILPRSDAPVRPASFVGRLKAPAESVDQRLKFPAWLDIFEKLGGTVDIQTADIDLLERCVRNSELVILATGKGPFADLFPLNLRSSPFKQPMRALSMIYLRGGHRLETPHCITSTAVDGEGGIMRFPALTHGGLCEILFFEALIGRGLDVGRSDMTADEQWSAMHAALTRVLPLEAERLAAARPTDDKASLVGRVTPAVRHIVGRLPSGGRVLGLADAVILNDPLVGQGGNNAAKLATLFLEAILHRGIEPFDEAWLEALAASAWRNVRAATIWTNLSLLPLSPHVTALLNRATVDQAAADLFVHGFEEPDALLPLLIGEEAAR